MPVWERPEVEKLLPRQGAGMTKQQADKIADALENFIAERAICIEPDMHDNRPSTHRLAETRNSLTAALIGPPQWPQDVDGDANCFGRGDQTGF